MNRPHADDSTIPLLKPSSRASICRAIFFRSQKIIRVQPLNAISVAESESPVSGGSGTLIRLRHDSNTFGLKLAHDGRR